MTVAESINKAISNGDIKSIRLMMKNSLLADPSFTEFDEMTRIAGNVRGLYDAHDGRELNGDKSAWNDDYMNNLMVQVVDNFSHERLNHLMEVVRYLRPAAARRQRSTSTGSTESGQIPPNRPSSSDRSSYSPGKRRQHNRGERIAAGAAVGGVAGGIIAGIAGGSILIGAAAAAVIAGAAVTVVTKGEKRDE